MARRHSSSASLYPKVDANTARLYAAAGQGIFGGLIAAPLSHWTVGEAFIIVMVFVYSFTMSALRGWVELCAVLAMLGTITLYFTVYDIVLLYLGLLWSILWCAVAFAAFVAYIVAVVMGTAGARINVLHRDGGVPRVDAIAIPLNNSERWEANYFATMRARRAAGQSYLSVLVRPIILCALGILLAFLLESKALSSMATCVALFQSAVFERVVTYSKRLNRSGGAVVVDEGERRPILLLRPFALDGLPVSAMDSDHWSSSLNILSWLNKRTFEEHLSTTFNDLGPVIAIGRPGEDVAPLGAAREYADDSSWRALVLRRAEASQLVIMLVDATPAMEWEIDQVSRTIGLRRILIVLPPDSDLHETRPTEWYERWELLRKRFEFLPPVTKETVAVMFSDDNQPILFPAGASSIPKRLAAIKKAWLEHTSGQS